jgi:hypothetical protein
MRLRLEKYSYRFVEQVLNGTVAIEQEVDEALTHLSIQIPTLSRPEFNKVLRDKFIGKGWQDSRMSFKEKASRLQGWIFSRRGSEWKSDSGMPASSGLTS